MRLRAASARTGHFALTRKGMAHQKLRNDRSLSFGGKSQQMELPTWSSLAQLGLDLTAFEFRGCVFVVQHPAVFSESSVFFRVFRNNHSRNDLFQMYSECFDVPLHVAESAFRSFQKRPGEENEARLFSAHRTQIVLQRVTPSVDLSLTTPETIDEAVDSENDVDSADMIRRFCEQLQVAFDAGLAFLRFVLCLFLCASVCV